MVAVVLTVCVIALLVDALLLTSPLYAAVMLWFPAASDAVAQFAVRILPLPERIMAAQPLIDVEPSLKFTVPVGLLPQAIGSSRVLLAQVVNIEGTQESARLKVEEGWRSDVKC